MSTQKPSEKLPKGYSKIPLKSGIIVKKGDYWEVSKGRYMPVSASDIGEIITIWLSDIYRKAPSATKRAKAPTVAKSARVPAKKAPAVTPESYECPVCRAFEIFGEGPNSENCIARMQEDIAKDIHAEFNRNEGDRTTWMGLLQFQRDKYRRYAYAALSSLGVIAKRKSK